MRRQDLSTYAGSCESWRIALASKAQAHIVLDPRSSRANDIFIVKSCTVVRVHVVGSDLWKSYSTITNPLMQLAGDITYSILRRRDSR